MNSSGVTMPDVSAASLVRRPSVVVTITAL